MRYKPAVTLCHCFIDDAAFSHKDAALSFSICKSSTQTYQGSDNAASHSMGNPSVLFEAPFRYFSATQIAFSQPSNTFHTSPRHP